MSTTQPDVSTSGAVGSSEGTVTPTTTTATGDTSSGGGTTAADTTGASTTTALPCEPASCDEGDCGSIDDGCGAQVDCGGCDSGLVCESNTCEAKKFIKATAIWKTDQTTYPVRAVAWSADGGRIATAGCADFPVEGEFVVWNSMSAKPVWGYQYPESPVLNLAWSPDGGAIVLGGRNSRPQIYSATNGNMLDELLGCHDGEINGVDWSSDDQKIVSAGATTVNPGATPEWCVWSSKTREVLHDEQEADTYAVNDIAFSADSTMFAVITDDYLSIRDADTYAPIDSVNFAGSFEDPWSLDGLSWSPDNLRLLVWSYEGFFIVDRERGEVRGGPLPGVITDATWSPSGLKFAISLANGKVRVYDRLADKLDMQFTAHDVATTIDWSLDEEFIATGGEVPRLAVWRLEY